MPPKKAQPKPAQAKPAAKSDAKPSSAKGGGRGQGTEQQPKASKAAKKDAKVEDEARGKAQLDAMMHPPSSDGSDEEEAAAPTRMAQGSGGYPSKKAGEKELESEFNARAREELLQQRAERLAEKERLKEEGAATGSKKTKDDALAAVLEKVSRDGAAKLSNKERRLYAKHQEALKEEEERAFREREEQQLGDDMQRVLAGLKDFSVSLSESVDTTTGAVDIRINRFTISAGGTRLFEDASLTLAKGRRYGFLGPNGQGKTTLLRHLAARKLPVPDHISIGYVEQEVDATGRPVVDEVLAADVKRRELLAEEADLLQRLEGSSDASEGEEVSAATLTSLCDRLQVVGEQLEVTGAEAAEAKVRKILCGLGFTDAMVDGPVDVLSGGWRMRVSLAKALFLEPDLLLLDEPTNHLDLDAVLWLDDYLSTFPKTLFVVSHDADFLDSVCTDVVHLENRGLVQYKGGYTEFKKAHAQRKRHLEKEYKKQQEQLKSGKKKVEEEVEKPVDYIVKFNFLPPVKDDEMCGISLHDAAFSYSGKKPWLLSGLNFRLDPSVRIVVVGPNGAGKSTLLNLVSKTSVPCEGEVVHSRGLVVGRYSQHFDEIAPALHLSAVDFLTSPALRRFGAGTESPELAHKCLGQFGLPGQAHRRPMKELSGGQKARVCFASITCRRPDILILDEPTNHLDIESVEALIGALKRYTGGLLLVTHDACIVQELSCQVWVCTGPQQSLRKVESFETYRREVLAELARRQAVAEREAKRRADLRRNRREETLKNSKGRSAVK
mmetsp:Transcript_34465/g.78637  ORF Transcript_34465/g.78637 Transcript_34465/m.78637 type:complete len:780 (+) Transcript_34465:58-2397(+)